MPGYRESHVNFLLYLVVLSLQLHMEDLCKEVAEHGSNLWILEAVEQGAEASQAKIHPNVLQSPIQESGEF